MHGCMREHTAPPVNQGGGEGLAQNALGPAGFDLGQNSIYGM